MDNLLKFIANNPLLALIVIGALLLITLLASVSGNSKGKRKRTNYRNNQDYYRNGSNYNRNEGLLSFNDQNNRNIQNEPITEITALNIVSNAKYFKCPLMNRSEYKLFRKLEKHLEKSHKGQIFRLFSQVAMGEFIKSESDDAFRLINGKRVDFVIVGSSGEAVVVIEYQGAGHYQDNAIERDAIKREACRKAGIEFLEFKKSYDDLEFERLSRILNANSPHNRRNTLVLARTMNH